MTKPDYHAQCEAPGEVHERRAWFDKVGQVFRSRGAVWLRQAIVPRLAPAGRDMLVLDGWNDRPEDEGEPSVDMTYTDPKATE